MGGNMPKIQYVELKKIISKLIKNQNIKIEDMGITNNDFSNNAVPCFDMALIKKLEGSNTAEKGSTSSHQSSILLTGEQSTIFPCIKRSEYFGEIIGKNMVLKLNLRLMENNILYIKNQKHDNENKVINTFLVTSEATGDRVEMGCKTLDGEEYVDFYESLSAQCFLIILKIRSKFEYIALAVKYSDASEYFEGLDISQKNLYFFYKINKISVNSKEYVTFIGSDSIVENPPNIDKGYNRLVYGAPGTGKSNMLEKDRESCLIDSYERVTFYPDYSYGQFVGMYKPYTKDKKIQYKFVPGPFLRMLVKALKFNNENHVIIIEEINRANAAAVFGDMFQLLDRNSNGEGEYSISLQEEVKDYLKEEGLTVEKLKIPSNFYIWATMNSADQGVVPLDSAFKRRFDDYKLISINENDSIISGINVDILCDGIRNIEWNEFRKKLNKFLISNRVKEDKLIGPFFIKPSILKNNEKFQQVFKDKLLMYLAEDVLRHKKREFFRTESLSEILSNYKENGKVFPNELLIDLGADSENE
jgi:5-methylcytosine-specific restriction enzyme B